MKRFCFPMSGRPQGPLSVALLLLLALLFSGPVQAEDVPAPVLTSFESFSKDWMARLEQVNQQNSRVPKTEPGSNGRVVGRYVHYGPDYNREVRGTDSRATPYVGILRYAQKMMEKEGETPQKMREHPGIATGEISVMEIFRYTGGRWVY